MLKGIDKILKLSVDDLPLYFWNQLKANITCIHEGTGRSIDDSVMIIHMVIQEIAKFGEALSHEGINISCMCDDVYNEYSISIKL